MKCYFILKRLLILSLFSICTINSLVSHTPGIYKQIVGISNQFLSDKKKIKSHLKYIKCEIKSGIINYVSKKIKHNEFYIHTTPCYVIIDTHNIRFYKNFDEYSLFDSVSINTILNINKSNPGAPCFDIVVNKVDKNVLYQGPLKLCGKNMKDMENWIDSINSFRHCKLSKKKEGKILVDFNRVNEIKKKGSPLDPLKYNSTDVAYINTPKENDYLSSIKKEIKSISNTIKSAKIAQNKMKRIMSGKLKKQRLISSKILQKQSTIRNNLLKNIKLSNVKEEQLLNIEHQHKEIGILTDLKKKIKEIKKREMKEFKKAYEKQIQSEKEKISKQGKIMMEMIMEQNKLTDFSKCTNSKLLKFTNKIYINSVCKQYFGEWGLGDCSLKINFCRMCCEHHIGVKHVHKLYSCKKKCTNLINGTPITKRESNKINAKKSLPKY